MVGNLAKMSLPNDIRDSQYVCVFLC